MIQGAFVYLCPTLYSSVIRPHSDPAVRDLRLVLCVWLSVCCKCLTQSLCSVSSHGSAKGRSKLKLRMGVQTIPGSLAPLCPTSSFLVAVVQLVEQPLGLCSEFNPIDLVTWHLTHQSNGEPSQDLGTPTPGFVEPSPL